MRSGGILLHISSLPSPCGIGTLGRAAYEFVDFLAAAGQRYWQILPVNPTSYGDSPYQSPSAFAGNPYFIDLDSLVAGGLLEPGELRAIDWGRPDAVNFALLYEERYDVLRKAQPRFEAGEPADYGRFCQGAAHWLDSYALFMALKGKYGGKSWTAWDAPLKLRHEAALGTARAELAGEIRFWKMLQYLFFDQWGSLKTYANGKGISIIGDLPIYVAEDSADVWSDPRYFQLKENMEPAFVAGCPPDGFSESGQLWGNPLFDWDVMRKDKFAWWAERLRHMSALYDITRIDHFRGFDAYYAISHGSTDAKNGQWLPGPGITLFESVKEQLGDISIIAEDLGFLTDSVHRLREETGFPGMRVMQFAFDGGGDGGYLPHNYQRDCVAYTGTHDNDTLRGWLDHAPGREVERAKEYFGPGCGEEMHWRMMEGVWASAADIAIVQMQDILGLGAAARMNTPATLGGNWEWRMLPGAVGGALAEKLRHSMRRCARSN